MKTEKQIQLAVDELKDILKRTEKEYYALHQIDMMSGEGSQLRAKISNTKGHIEALEWVLKGGK